MCVLVFVINRQSTNDVDSSSLPTGFDVDEGSLCLLGNLVQNCEVCRLYWMNDVGTETLEFGGIYHSSDGA